MAELLIPIREYIGKSEWNWDTFEFEWATSVEDVRMAIEWAQYDGMDVTAVCLEIGVCYGGSVLHGLEIYNYLKGLGLPVRTRILSLAASMGSVIPLVGDEIEIEQTAQVLVHGPSGYAGGTVQQVASDLKQLTDLHHILRDVYVARTGQSAEVVDEWMSKDTWFTAEEALAAGLVTKVIPLAPKTVAPATEAQASARRAKFAGIVARADKRTVRALSKPKPKAASRPAAISPKPMAKTVTAPKAGTKNPVALSAQQKAAAAAVAEFAKQMGVKATIEGADDAGEVTAVATATVLADGAGTLYTDGALAVGSAVYNDEALTEPTDDATYEAEDGREIVIVDHAVSEINTPEAEGGEEAPAAASAEVITAAVAAALAPITARLDAMEGKFAKALPPTPSGSNRPKPQTDAKNADKAKPRAAHHSTL